MCIGLTLDLYRANCIEAVEAAAWVSFFLYKSAVLSSNQYSVIVTVVKWKVWKKNNNVLSRAVSDMWSLGHVTSQLRHFAKVPSDNLQTSSKFLCSVNLISSTCFIQVCHLTLPSPLSLLCLVSFSSVLYQFRFASVFPTSTRSFTTSIPSYMFLTISWVSLFIIVLLTTVYKS